MRNHGAEILTVPCDDEECERTSWPNSSKKPPGRQSGQVHLLHRQLPQSSRCTLSVERRRKLLDLAYTYDVPILEDDPYGYVRFDGEHLPSLFSLADRGIVLFACSFSKILAPGTRIGWCVGNKEIIRKTAVFKQGVDVYTSVVSQAMVYEYCRLGYLESFLPRIIDHYRKKRDAMEEAFRRYLPLEEVSWVKPQGGFFYWLETPRIEAKKLFEKAVENNVAFVLGEPFYPNGGDSTISACATPLRPPNRSTKDAVASAPP